MGILDALFGESGSKYTDKIGDIFTGINAPSIEDQRLILDQYVEQGILTPEQAQAELLNSNAYDNMQLDTEGKQAQLAALQSLSQIGSEGGLTASDRSKLQGIQNQEQAAQRGSREAILQNAQARGVGGSGLELMAQLQNQQESASRQSARDLDVAAMAQERALQALQSAGQLGGQVNQQQFGQQAQIADQANEIARFNAANKQQVGLTNVAANNAAQQANLQNKQTISNANVDQRNKQQQYNKELSQQKFNNELNLGQAKSGALGSQAQQANQNRANNQGLLGTVIGAGATAVASDERGKEEIEEFDPSEFLDSLTGYKYRYKNPSNGKGKQVGVMAQDLESSDAGRAMVEDTPKGKIVDYGKGMGAVLASVANVHDRLKKLEGG